MSSSWGSWLREQASVVTEGFREFSDQLQDDTEEVRQEVSTKLKDANEKVGAKLSTANEKLSETLRAVGENTSLSQLGELSANGAARLSAMDGLSLDGVLKKAESALASAERSTSNLLATGAERLRRVADTANDGASAGPSKGAEKTGANSQQRVDERMRLMEADTSSFAQPPADGASFERWCAGFELLAHTEQIEALLRSREPLRATHTALVPGVLSYRLFWQRYFYALEQLRQQEEKRLAMLRRVAAPPATTKLSSWDFDDDAFLNAPSKPPAAKPRATPLRIPPTPPPRPPAAPATSSQASSSPTPPEVASPSASTKPRAPAAAASPRHPRSAAARTPSASAASTAGSGASAVSSSGSSAEASGEAASTVPIDVPSYLVAETSASSSGAPPRTASLGGGGTGVSSEQAGERAGEPEAEPASAAEAADPVQEVPVPPRPICVDLLQARASFPEGASEGAATCPPEGVVHAAADRAVGDVMAEEVDVGSAADAEQMSTEGSVAEVAGTLDAEGSVGAAGVALLPPRPAAASVGSPVADAIDTAPAASSPPAGQAEPRARAAATQRRNTSHMEGSTASSVAASEEFSVIGSDDVGSVDEDASLVEREPAAEELAAVVWDPAQQQSTHVVPVNATAAVPPPVPPPADEDDWADWE